MDRTTIGGESRATGARRRPRTLAARPLSLLALLWLGLCLATAAASGSTDDALRARAEAGDAASQAQLGYEYFRHAGHGPAGDYAQALAWFRRAADQGDAKGESYLGMMYYSGRGVPRDYAQAAHWYRLAAAQGDDHAQRRLQVMYAQGQGVPKDRAESRRWSRQIEARNPRSHSLEWLFAGVAAVLLVYVAALAALQWNRVPGVLRLPAMLYVHATGCALFINCLITYGIELVFPRCSYGFLAASCSAYQDPATRHLAEELRNWQTMNLLFRFMGGFGLVLDALLVWYVIYVYRSLRGPRMALPAGRRPHHA